MEQKDMILDIAKDPYNYVMRVVFCRWKPFILQAMDTDEVTNFSRFCKQLPITQKVLTQNLKALKRRTAGDAHSHSRHPAPDGVPAHPAWKKPDSSFGSGL